MGEDSSPTILSTWSQASIKMEKELSMDMTQSGVMTMDQL